MNRYVGFSRFLRITGGEIKVSFLRMITKWNGRENVNAANEDILCVNVDDVYGRGQVLTAIDCDIDWIVKFSK